MQSVHVQLALDYPTMLLVCYRTSQSSNLPYSQGSRSSVLAHALRIACSFISITSLAYM